MLKHCDFFSEFEIRSLDVISRETLHVIRCLHAILFKRKSMCLECDGRVDLCLKRCPTRR